MIIYIFCVYIFIYFYYNTFKKYRQYVHNIKTINTKLPLNKYIMIMIMTAETNGGLRRLHSTVYLIVINITPYYYVVFCPTVK